MKDWVKYPRTYHLPCSPGATSDDKFMDDSILKRCIVVSTEKLDGENTTLYHDGFHARSLNYKYNQTRDIISRWHSLISHRIPIGVRICGENISYKHSIGYLDMDHFFYVHSIWGGDECWSVDETVDFCDQIGLKSVYTDHVLAQGDFQSVLNRSIHMMENTTHETEGFVIRSKSYIKSDEFHDLVGKWVRPNHIQTDEHWSKNAQLNGFNMNVLKGN